MSLPVKSAVRIQPRVGKFVGKKAIRQAVHKAISKSLRVAVVRTNRQMHLIVPEDTGRLLASGIRTLNESLIKATAGINLKRAYVLKTGWQTPYARFVTEFNQSTTDWTKPGSRAKYNILIENFLKDQFRTRLQIEINKLSSPSGRPLVVQV